MCVKLMLVCVMLFLGLRITWFSVLLSQLIFRIYSADSVEILFTL